MRNRLALNFGRGNSRWFKERGERLRTSVVATAANSSRHCEWCGNEKPAGMESRAACSNDCEEKLNDSFGFDDWDAPDDLVGDDDSRDDCGNDDDTDVMDTDGDGDGC